MAIHHRPLGFSYGNDVTGPMPEIRRLDQIRASLRDPTAKGRRRCMPSPWMWRGCRIVKS
jgi:hypothetical protein